MALDRGERALQSPFRIESRQRNADPAAARLADRSPRRADRQQPHRFSRRHPAGPAGGRRARDRAARADPEAAARGGRAAPPRPRACARFPTGAGRRAARLGAVRRGQRPLARVTRRPADPRLRTQLPARCRGRAPDRLRRCTDRRAVQGDARPALRHPRLQARQGRAGKDPGSAPAGDAGRQADRGDRTRQARRRAADPPRRAGQEHAADDRCGVAGICGAAARHQFRLGSRARRADGRDAVHGIDARLRSQQLLRRDQPARMGDAVGERPRAADEQGDTGALSAGFDGQADEHAGADGGGRGADRSRLLLRRDARRHRRLPLPQARRPRSRRHEDRGRAIVRHLLLRDGPPARLRHDRAGRARWAWGRSSSCLSRRSASAPFPTAHGSRGSTRTAGRSPTGSTRRSAKVTSSPTRSSSR